LETKKAVRKGSLFAIQVDSKISNPVEILKILLKNLTFQQVFCLVGLIKGLNCKIRWK